MNSRLNRISVALSLASALTIAGFSAAQSSEGVVKIGLITDMSGPYADLDGAGGAAAIRMAIADFGGAVNGKKIELMVADHLNKADVAAGLAREWFDVRGVDMLVGGTNSAANLAMAKVAADKKKPFLAVGPATARLTNEDCTPYTVHYAYDTVALARGTGAALVKQGGKTWYFLTVDYAFGASLEKDTSDVIRANGGTVVGSVRHPTDTADFSSYLLQAQASKAEILGLANAGADMINSIKAANEFGITKTMKLALLLPFITDIHSLGLDVTQGSYLTDSWYWDQNDATRAWSKRFETEMKREPTSLQAADYSATLTYLKAVKAIGTEDGDKVMQELRTIEINDMYAPHGVIRPDGRMVHDMYLFQVKTPQESKYPWDYYKLVQTIPGEDAFMKKSETKCALWQ